jgi:hypothetical protein
MLVTLWQDSEDELRSASAGGWMNLASRIRVWVLAMAPTHLKKAPAWLRRRRSMASSAVEQAESWLPDYIVYAVISVVGRGNRVVKVLVALAP